MPVKMFPEHWRSVTSCQFVLFQLRKIANGSPVTENPEEERLLPVAQEILAYNSEEGSHVDATVSLFEAIIELDDDETTAFRAINQQHARGILYVVSTVFVWL